jgi:hypothetical protein
VLVGGMTIGTIFTLFIVPSLYMLIAKTHNEGREEEHESPDSNGNIESGLAAELPEPALARDGIGRWSPA